MLRNDFSMYFRIVPHAAVPIGVCLPDYAPRFPVGRITLGKLVISPPVEEELSLCVPQIPLCVLLQRRRPPHKAISQLRSSQFLSDSADDLCSGEKISVDIRTKSCAARILYPLCRAIVQRADRTPEHKVDG